MTWVIVAHEKHGTFTYASARAVLRQRINEGWWYDGEDALRAVKAFESGSEEVAWRFLESRSDHEYEYVEKQTVQS